MAWMGARQAPGKAAEGIVNSGVEPSSGGRAEPGRFSMLEDGFHVVSSGVALGVRADLARLIGSVVDEFEDVFALQGSPPVKTRWECASPHLVD